MPESVLHWGIEFILSVQQLGDWLTGVMNGFTFLGNEDFYLLLFPFLYWCVNTSLGIRIGMYLILSIGLNSILKTAFHAPRPYWFDPRVQLLTGGESSFGLPSGHAQNSVAIWGGLATQFRRKWVWGLVTALIIFVGFSRIYLGVHFPTDVLVGWLLGIIILWVAIRFEKPVLAWFKQMNMGQQVGTFFAISLGAILLHALVIQITSSAFQLPVTWVQTASLAAPDDPIVPYSLSGTVTIMGAAFGFISGVVWLGVRGGLNAQGTWWLKTLRFVVGIVGVLAIRYGLDILFNLLAAEESTGGYALRFIRYSTIGFWMSALAPLVFFRLKLAERTG